MNSTVEELLAGLSSSATSERDKGDKFERLVKRFLTVDAAWARRFSEVYLWSEWPDRAGQPDRGIDLVAVERETGALVAVQCKFYAPDHYLAKSDIDSFLSESGKHPFAARLVVSTTDRWNSAAEAAIRGQQIPVSRIGLSDLVASSIDWSQFSFAEPERLARRPRKELRPHQVKALEAVREGFGNGERGKLIMACGTGKTLTSLRIAEDLVGSGGSVLFLVPSIALASQSLKEWSQEAAVPLRTFAVCSDLKVGKGGGLEDISVVDLEIPATTDPARLAEQVARNSLVDDAAPQVPDPSLAACDMAREPMTVVFSTYQSIDVIHRAQALGMGRFDLIVCDEAHRTTGATLAGDDESAFVRVHDDSYIGGAKRLYMTATPRIYDDASKAKAGEADALLASMDDEALYGPEFHRLDFGEAVGLGLLSDYRVLILTVPESAVSRVMQSAFAANSELNLPDAAKIIGCWNGLAKRGDAGDFLTDPGPMRRAVAFSGSIATSKKFEGEFAEVIDHYAGTLEEEATSVDSDGAVVVEASDPLAARVHHVDGTMNILVRNAALDWLRSEPGPGNCRVLTNARCLAEGVDVPGLDAVIFLNPRKSEVDVVQAVGRVMRQAPGKKYGYIILPVAIPAGEKPELALRDNQRYCVIWKVLQALRAHDSRFNAMINQIELNKTTPEQVRVIGVDVPEPSGQTASPVDEPGRWVMDPMDLGEWRDAIFAKIVTKVGSRRYWEDWAKDVAQITAAHTARLTDLVESGNGIVRSAFAAFLGALRANLNPSIDQAQAIDMLSQHMITKPVFDALFEGYSFTAHNPVAQVMQSMLTALEGLNLDSETASLEKFYESVRIRVQGIDNAEGKQRVLMELYEKFFRLAFKKTSESLGIVYTPVEVVDFIIRAVDDLLREHFNTALTADGVHVLDPFAGTGTFMVRMLESGLIKPEDLARKYASELHANEILLLAYYIAAANIEVTYHAVAGQPEGEYKPFDGIVLADTFQMTEAGDTLDSEVFLANAARAKAELELLASHRIQVILGNPPYSVGQASQNDANANLRYPTLDSRIEQTYVQQSYAGLKRNMYDSYIRAIRWASDQIGEAGVVAFVSNGGYIDGNSADGLRKCLAAEFDAVYVYNLRGNARSAGDLRQREAGNVFGSGSRNTVAVLLLVKRPGRDSPAKLYYHDIGDYLSREQKLSIVGDSRLATLPWEAITPNENGDWINQRGDLFGSFRPLVGSREALLGASAPGVSTGRDAWAYGFSEATVRQTMARLSGTFNSELNRLASEPLPRSGYVIRDPRSVSWTAGLLRRFDSGKPLDPHGASFVISQYRPFDREILFADPALIERPGSLARFFPSPALRNSGFTLTGVSSHYEFCAIATDRVPNLHLLDSGQFFPRWRWEPVADSDERAARPEGTQGELRLETGADGIVQSGYRRIDNITDAALADYRRAYGRRLTKDDVFHYVYGLLHSPDYRREFAADLKKTLPRVPLVEDSAAFWAFVRAGRDLMELHIGYEAAEPWPGLEISGNAPQSDPYEWFRVEKMRYGGKGTDKDKSVVVVNPRVTVSGIPLEAQAYMLGARSALDWIIERYQVKTDKASGIVNDPNAWSREHGQPRYILDLLTRIVTVSMRTNRIVDSLPRLEFSERGAVPLERR
ncbi:MAG: DEAD/DEAH box helicase family protein [Bifidobacteriaceae bacterium]|jgi:predicted helicase|nr:DEAD/DEAH box helicase family protein [Bifidobacteriaceae bacterium]